MTGSYNTRLGTAPEEGIKAPCRATSVNNIALSGAQTIDGVAIVAGDRVLVQGQTTATENGIYNAATGAWSRATDWNGNDDIVSGILVNVAEGASYAKLYRVSFSGDHVLGTTEYTFEYAESAGEVNTGSNQGTDGVGVFDTKSDLDLQFRNIAPASSKVTVTLNGKDIDIDIVPANISHTNIANVGSNTHAQIDTHIANSALHREIDDGALGATDLWSASKISTELSGKSSTSHTHSGVYEPADATILKDADIGATVQAYSAVLAATTASFTTADESKLDSMGVISSADASTLTGGGSADSLHTHSGGDSSAIHDDTAAEISAITEKSTPASGDWLIIEDSAASDAKKKVQVGNLPTAGGGEANTASNQGTDGVGVYDTKSGIDLQFRNIAPASSKLTVTLNSKDIDLDVVPGNINHGDIAGTGTNSHSVIDTHIADSSKHRIINDSGTSITELWSANKINSELSGKEDVDATILRQSDVDDTPVDSATTVPVSSNWAYDHENASNPHSIDKSDVGLSNVTNDAQIAKSLGTAKGDVVGFTASATPARLGAGSNGQVLTVDSAQSIGFKWGDVSGEGYSLVDTSEPTSDVDNITFTGLSAYRDVKLHLILEKESSAANFGSGAEIQARASGGTWRTLYTFANSGINDFAIGTVEVINFGKSTNAVKFTETKISETTSVTIDRSDANIEYTPIHKMRYTTYTEQWDELRVYIPNTIEGTTVDERAYVEVLGRGTP